MSMTNRIITVWALLGLALLVGCSGPTVVQPRHAGLPTFTAEASSWWQDAEAGDDDVVVDDEEAVLEEDEPERERRGIGRRLLFYIPNRIFDVFDIVRARVRIGPGIAIGARATDFLDAYIGTYATLFVGIHGPRGEPSIPWPIGFESKSGVEASVLDGTADGGVGPNYGKLEFGVSLQALLVGFDVGVDPLEILDLIAGLVTIDLTGDDY